MDDLTATVEQHERSLPGIERIHGYISDINTLRNDKPDHVVELCSALIECASKNILKSHEHSDTLERVEGEKLKSGVRKSLNKVKYFDPLIDDAIVGHLCDAVQDLGKLRNKRGEVVHGRVHPKLESSSIRFQDLILRFTESIAIYLIEVTADCASIDLGEDEAQIEYGASTNENFNSDYDIRISAELAEKEIDAPEFFQGNSPSYALYLLDYEEYVEQLEEWMDQNQSDSIS